MALNKKTLNDFLPNGFETQNKEDYKVNFSEDKIAVGFDKDTLEVLSGPNLNNLLDTTGKNFHTLNDFLNYFNQMPIGSFPIVNASNQLDYKSVNSFFRNVGELVFSAIPLEDGNLRLLDGSLLEYNMTYSRFIIYIAGLRGSLPNLFCTEQEFNQSIATYGVCGKFVYNTVTKSLRLPKITGFIKGTLDSGSLGDVDEAKAPQHSHSATLNNAGGHNHNRGDMEIWGNMEVIGDHPYVGADGSFYIQNVGMGGNPIDTTPDGGSDWRMSFNASRTWTGNTSWNGDHTHGINIGDANNNTFKAGNINEPQAIKEFIYIVVSIDEAEKQVLSAVYNYKGSVENYEDLPTAVAIGEVYNVIGEDPDGYSGANFAWTGEEWDRLGGTVNLSGYLTKTEARNTYATKASLESNVEVLQQQINTNASNIANIASQEVIEQGIKKIEALKFASTIGHGITNDVDLYAVINKYAHSSFDRSKFTVVGTPTITDDGIITSASSSNYVQVDLDVSQDHIFEIEVNGNNNTLTGGGFQMNYGYQMYISPGVVNRIGIYAHSGNNSFLTWLYNDAFRSDYTLRLRITKTDLTYKVEYWVNDIEQTPIITTLETAPDYQNYIRFQYSPTPQHSVNLKKLSFTVNGQEVFSGNKTGIDTIKPDDYTVVGTPTISVDGIASGFSTSNYITLPQNPDLSGKFEILVGCLTPSSFTAENYLVSYLAGDSAMGLKFSSNRKLYWNINKNSGESTASLSGSTIYNTNTFYFIKIGYDGSQYYIKYSTDGINYTLDNKRDEATPILTDMASQLIRIGISPQYNPDRPFTGSIDLNTFKIYADGNLVYQPCLKIPYTLSNTNLKITRNMDRAIDMANQCGFSDYFGLDEDNMTCLVPQGDNITGRRDLVHREEDSTTHYVTEIYSDLYCKQMASCTANTAVTFAQPYKDEYYKLSIPYSAKSKTGFTPTVSGDWTAEGYIYLS